MPDDMREQLAALAHEQWSGWVLWMFEQGGTFNPDGTWTMTKDKVDRWLRQSGTAYAELPETEKDSDRKEADKVLAIIGVYDGE